MVEEMSDKERAEWDAPPLMEQHPIQKGKGMSWGFVVLIGLAFGLLITAIVAPVLTFSETAERLQDLNFSFQNARMSDLNEHSVLASLIVQGAMLNDKPDENDQFVQAWKTQCSFLQDINGIEYYGCLKAPYAGRA